MPANEETTNKKNGSDKVVLGCL